MECKGIKEKASICLSWQFIERRITMHKAYTIASSWAVTINKSLFIQSFIVFYTNGVTTRLVCHKNADTALATAVIDEGIFLANMTTICQALQHTIIRRLIRMMLRIRPTIIAACCLYL